MLGRLHAVELSFPADADEAEWTAAQLLLWTGQVRCAVRKLRTAWMSCGWLLPFLRPKGVRKWCGSHLLALSLLKHTQLSVLLDLHHLSPAPMLVTRWV
jgi:hypothetical protein